MINNYFTSKLDSVFSMCEQNNDILLILNQHPLLQALNQDAQLQINKSTFIRQSSFTFQEKSVDLILYQKFLELRTDSSSLQENVISYYIKFDFSVIVEQICQNKDDPFSQKIGFSLFKEASQPLTFFSQQSDILSEWMYDFSKIVFLSGFANQYKSTKYIGRGEFAQVWQVEKLTTNTKYAAKIIDKQICFGRVKGEQVLYNEIQILRKLNHQNVLHLQSVYSSQKRIYIVMDLMQGISLAQFIQTHGFTLEKSQIAKIMKDLLKGTSYLHKQNIAHRDLKPGNIIINEDNYSPFIIDFGLSQFCVRQEQLFQFCGSPGYMAPQLFSTQNKIQDIRKCDIFSLGAIFYLLLTGKPLLQADTDQQILNQNKNCQKIISSKLKTQLQQNEIKLLLDMLNPDPILRITAEQALRHEFFIQIVCDTLQQFRQNFSQIQNKVQFSLQPKGKSKFDQLFSESSMTISHKLSFDKQIQNQYQVQKHHPLFNSQTLKTKKMKTLKIKSKRSFSEDNIDTNFSNISDNLPDLAQSGNWKKFKVSSIAQSALNSPLRKLKIKF